MITSYSELQYYLECDRIALERKNKKPPIFGDDIWKFQICMRKLDYYNKMKGIMKWYYRFKYHKLSLKLGFSIPCNVIEPGLAIVHYGAIVISQMCIRDRLSGRGSISRSQSGIPGWRKR